MKNKILLIGLITFSVSSFANSNCNLVVLEDTLEQSSSELEGLKNFSRSKIKKVIQENTPKSYKVSFSDAGYTDEKQLSVNFQLKYGVFTGFARVCSAIVTIADYRNNKITKVTSNNLNADCSLAAKNALSKLRDCR